jgi:hypothetical protein
MSDCTERHPLEPDDGLVREGQERMLKEGSE